MNAIVAIITVIVAIILFTSIAYVKAPPNRAAIITGLLKFFRILLKQLQSLFPLSAM